MSFLRRWRSRKRDSDQADGSEGASHLERGNRHFSQGNMKAALADFENAVEFARTEHDKLVAYFNRGRTYNRMNQWVNARRFLVRQSE